MHRIFGVTPGRPEEETMWTYDTETPGLNAPAAVIWCLENIRTREQYVFYDRGSFRSFIESQAPAILWAHNGNRFDIFSCLSAREAYDARKVSTGTRLFEVEYNGVKYRDSKHLFPMSLARLAETVGMEKGITPEKFLTGEPLTREDLDEDDVRYCMMDVAILAEAIRSFRDMYARLVGRDTGEVGIPLTTASAAYRIWCAMSWPEHWQWRDAKGKFRPVGRGRSFFNTAFRRSEAGGMVRLLNTSPGELVEGGIVSYDANSMYPSVMIDETFPDITSGGFMGADFTALANCLSDESRVFLAEISLSASEGAYMGAPNRDEEGRRDWNQSSFSGWMCGPEISFLLQNGWTVDGVSNIISFRAIRPFTNYVRTLYRMRMEMREQGNPNHALAKLCMNSLYGRFGIKEKPTRIDGAALDELVRSEDYVERMESGELERGFYDGMRAQWPYVLDYSTMRKAPTSQWFGFSSFILSRARVRLGEAIIAAGDDGLYTDTDSVHMRARARERFEDMVSIGDELGQWKLETPDVIPCARYWEPKAYVHYESDGVTRRLVKHKGIMVRDDKGEYLPDAGDLTKIQTTRTTVSLYEGLRRDMEPGTEIVTQKKSSRFYRNS